MIIFYINWQCGKICQNRGVAAKTGAGAGREKHVYFILRVCFLLPAYWAERVDIPSRYL